MIFAIFLTGCAHEDPWRTSDTVMQLGVTAVLVADGITTSRIHDTPGVWESGPITAQVLGRQPSSSDTALYFSTLIISNYLISRALPHRWRRTWQVIELSGHGYAVYNNCSRGLC